MPDTPHPLPITSTKFITFEGGEGAGKSTQVKMLAEALKKAGRRNIVTREPGGTAGAESIRELLVKGSAAKWEAPTELLLHLAARYDHVHKILKPALDSGKDVICDRFTDSTLAYQAYGHGLGRAFVESLCQLVIGNFRPDLTIILDIDIVKGIKRAGDRGTQENRYETMGVAFHERVRAGFLEISRQNLQRCVVINAENGIDAIHNQVIEAVGKRLGIAL